MLVVAIFLSVQGNGRMDGLHELLSNNEAQDAQED